ncbi:hypothetical protein E2I00_011658, partial [Balaenoptera physalus]
LRNAAFLYVLLPSAGPAALLSYQDLQFFLGPSVYQASCVCLGIVLAAQAWGSGMTEVPEQPQDLTSNRYSIKLSTGTRYKGIPRAAQSHLTRLRWPSSGPRHRSAGTARMSASLVRATVRAVSKRKLQPTRAALTLTPSAVNKIKQLLKDKPEHVGVKVGVRTRGCNGLSYTLEYAKTKGDSDEEVVQDGTLLQHLHLAKPPPDKVKEHTRAIHQTPSAVNKIKQLLKDKPEHVGVKVGVRTRGCNGLSYTLEYTKTKGDSDEEVIQDGVRVFIEKKAQLTLLGTEMDYVEDKLSSEFVFNNPNIKG